MTIKTFVLAYAKALTALLATIITMVAGHYGLKLDDALTAALATALIGLAVALVPNTPPAPPSNDTPAPNADGKDPRMTPAPPKEPPARLRSGFFMQRLYIAAALVCFVVVSCLPVRDALTLTGDEINCVMQAADENLTTEQAIVKCGMKAIPDVIRLVTDLMATQKAAHRAGHPWHFDAADAGFCPSRVPCDAGAVDASAALHAAEGAQHSFDQATHGMVAANALLLSVATTADAGAAQ